MVDETDRLLRQAYQDWLPHVAGLTSRASPAAAGGGAEHDAAGAVKVVASATLTQDPAKIGRLELHAPRYIAMSSTDHRQACMPLLRSYHVPWQRHDHHCVLTSACIGCHMICVWPRYKVPLQLKEYQMVGAAVDKPLLLTALLQHLRPARVVVFAASLQATHRLGEIVSVFACMGDWCFPCYGSPLWLGCGLHVVAS